VCLQAVDRIPEQASRSNPLHQSFQGTAVGRAGQFCFDSGQTEAAEPLCQLDFGQVLRYLLVGCAVGFVTGQPLLQFINAEEKVALKRRRLIGWFGFVRVTRCGR